jgi:peptide chain release factor 1
MRLNDKLLGEIQKLISEIKTIDSKLSLPDLSQEDLIKLSKKRSKLSELDVAYKKFEVIRKKLTEAESVLETESDSEIIEMANFEVSELEKEINELEKKILKFVFPDSESEDVESIILEVRSGAGGDEAGLFAEEIMQMYLKYAEKMGWKTEFANLQRNQANGIKEAIILMSGDDIFKRIQFESGVHRVQRVPETEASGRIHTSTVTVAVLAESKAVEEIELKPEEIKIEVFRSSGPGGQSVNTTDSAVRITHIPTGLTVSCQDEKSQHKNKDKALRILKSRIYDQEKEKQREKEISARKSQIGTGERNEKIRTYNYPQSRVTDHRIKFTSGNLHGILNGNLDEIFDELENASLEKRVSLLE